MQGLSETTERCMISALSCAVPAPAVRDRIGRAVRVAVGKAVRLNRTQQEQSGYVRSGHAGAVEGDRAAFVGQRFYGYARGRIVDRRIAVVAEIGKVVVDVGRRYRVDIRAVGPCGREVICVELELPAASTKAMP